MFGISLGAVLSAYIVGVLSPPVEKTGGRRAPVIAAVTGGYQAVDRLIIRDRKKGGMLSCAGAEIARKST